MHVVSQHKGQGQRDRVYQDEDMPKVSQLPKE